MSLGIGRGVSEVKAEKIGWKLKVGVPDDGDGLNAANVDVLPCGGCETKDLASLSFVTAPVFQAEQQRAGSKNQAVDVSAANRPKLAERDSATGLIITIATLLVFQVLGDVVVRFADVPIPGGVAGLAIFLLYLARRGSVPFDIGNTVPIFLRHLPLLFVPAGVGVVAYTGQLSTEWMGLALTIAGSTTLTIVVTATVFSMASRSTEKKTTKGGGNER